MICRRVVVALASLAFVACDSDSLSPFEPAALSTCASPLLVAASESTTRVDIADGPAGPLALPECWGVTHLANTPPQAVIAYTVPGVGQSRTTIDVEAPPELDVVLDVRRGGCESAAWAHCFDVGEPGSVTVETVGGERLYVVVTAREGESRGSNAVDVGAIQLTWSSAHGAVPELESATIELFQGTMRAELSGTDADADVVGAMVWWTLPFGRSPMMLGDLMTFDDDLHGRTRFDATVTATDYASLETDDVRSAEAVLIDDFGNSSAPHPVSLIRVVEVGYDDLCDGETRRCARQLECRDDRCRAPIDVLAACRDAEIVELPTPTTEATTLRRTGELVHDDGVIRGSDDCYGKTPGVEHLYRVVVPEGRYDLIARTDIEGPGDDLRHDNVVYIRRTCDDPETQVACSDMGLRERVVLPDAEPGEYTIFVEDFDGVDAGDSYPYELEVALRPVLPTGATCDAAADSLVNRCAEGACTRAGVCP